MSQHSVSKKPNWQSSAVAKAAYNANNIVASEAGWVDSRTGELLVAIRGLTSRGQGASDLATPPVFSVKALPSAKNYKIAKADVIRLTLASSEVVKVTGLPQIKVTFAGDNTAAAAERQLTFVESKSSSQKLVFEYTLQGTDAPYVGQIVSIANTWTNNGGSIKDYSATGTLGSALTPSTWTVGSVTGIVVSA